MNVQRPTLLKLAAAYNFTWGTAAIIAPRHLARVLGLYDAGDGMGWRAAGVVVLAYAPAYFWAADHRREAKPMIATATFGKLLGVVGWIVGFVSGRFGPRTILLPVFNDLVWLPGLLKLLR